MSDNLRTPLRTAFKVLIALGALIGSATAVSPAHGAPASMGARNAAFEAQAPAMDEDSAFRFKLVLPRTSDEPVRFALLGDLNGNFWAGAMPPRQDEVAAPDMNEGAAPQIRERAHPPAAAGQWASFDVCSTKDEENMRHCRGALVDLLGGGVGTIVFAIQGVAISNGIGPGWAWTAAVQEGRFGLVGSLWYCSWIGGGSGIYGDDALVMGGGCRFVKDREYDQRRGYWVEGAQGNFDGTNQGELLHWIVGTCFQPGVGCICCPLASSPAPARGF